jgi:hypothetical protein
MSAFSANYDKEQEKTGKTARVFEASYSRVEAALVRTYGVRNRDLARFRARITFLQKGGLLGVSPGKGKAVAYTPDLFHRLLFAMELAEVGVTPAAILQTVADLWERSIQRHFEKAERALNAAPDSQDIILLMSGVSLMVGGWVSTAKALPNVNGFPLHRLADNMKLVLQHSDPKPRACILNLSERLRAFHAALAATAE